jgi:phosphoglycolate phosphatase
MSGGDLPRKLCHVLFDLDGTLTDPREGIECCFASALRQLGAPVPDATSLRRFIGPPLQQGFAELLNTSDAGRIDRAVTLYRERYARAGALENRLYPGVRSALEELRRAGYRLVVVTSKAAPFAEQVLRHFDLRSLFEAVHAASLDGRLTGKEALIAQALQQHKLRPQQAVMVGDRKYDMLGARANGVLPWGAGWGYGSAQELHAAGAAEIFPDIEHLVAALLRRP